MIATLIWLWLMLLGALLIGGILAVIGRNVRDGAATARRERQEQEAARRDEWIAFGRRH